MFLNFFLLFRLRDEKIFLQMKQQEERQKKALERSQAQIKKTEKKKYVLPQHKMSNLPFSKCSSLLKGSYLSVPIASCLVAGTFAGSALPFHPMLSSQ